MRSDHRVIVEDELHVPAQDGREQAVVNVNDVVAGHGPVALT
jgi:hypothetical protein